MSKMMNKGLIGMNFPGDNVFFTSDTHFWHKNILEFCKRPFKSIEEMNEELIKRWNNKVNEDSIIFHLGDFAFCGSQQFNEILERLKGHIYLCVGNHDFKNLRQGYMGKFEMVNLKYFLRVDDRPIILNHEPLLCYGGTYRRKEDSVWQLYGHVHSGPYNTGKDSERLVNTFPSQYDVGVDNNDFTPVSYEEVKNIIEKQYEEREG